GPYPNDSTLTGLCAGTYNLTLTDARNCVLAASVVVGQADSITENLNVSDATCLGTCDGMASVTPSGGTAPYTYLWSNGATTSSTSGLCVGAASVTITDANGCNKVVNFNVTSPSQLTVSTTTTDASCKGTCDGMASVTPSGGTAPYTYLWSNGATTSSTSGLCVGAASVTITDANGCNKVVNFNVTSPSQLTVSTTTTDASCNGDCDGTATATPNGGTAPYTYSWNDALNQTTPTATGLCAGTYNVQVTDANGCFTVETVTINEPAVISPNLTTTDATCGNPDGTATVAPTGGTAPY